MNAQHTDPGRIDPDHYETSPSCGSFEVAAIYGCPDAHAVEADTDSHPDAVHLEDTAMFHESSFSLEVAQ